MTKYSTCIFLICLSFHIVSPFLSDVLDGASVIVDVAYDYYIGWVNIQGNTTHLYTICTMSAQHLRRWSNIIQMLYRCFVFTGMPARGSVGEGWVGVTEEVRMIGYVR